MAFSFLGFGSGTNTQNKTPMSRGVRQNVLAALVDEAAPNPAMLLGDSPVKTTAQSRSKGSEKLGAMLNKLAVEAGSMAENAIKDVERGNALLTEADEMKADVVAAMSIKKERERNLRTAYDGSKLNLELLRVGRAYVLESTLEEIKKKAAAEEHFGKSRVGPQAGHVMTARDANKIMFTMNDMKATLRKQARTIEDLKDVAEKKGPSSLLHQDQGRAPLRRQDGRQRSQSLRGPQPVRRGLVPYGKRSPANTRGPAPRGTERPISPVLEVHAQIRLGNGIRSPRADVTIDCPRGSIIPRRTRTQRPFARPGYSVSPE